MSESGELVMYVGGFVYAVAYFFTKNVENALLITLAVAIVAAPVMLIGCAISHEASGHGSFLAFAKHCVTWFLKMLATIFLTTPFALVAVRNAIQCVNIFNKLQEEWDYDGLCYKTALLSVAVSLLFYSCVYLVKQLMQFMD